jgi:hypothetical protein
MSEACKRKTMTRIGLVVVLTVALLGQSWSINLPLERPAVLTAGGAGSGNVLAQLNDIDDESRNAHSFCLLFITASFTSAAPILLQRCQRNSEINLSVDQRPLYEMDIVLLI